MSKDELSKLIDDNGYASTLSIILEIMEEEVQDLHSTDNQFCELSLASCLPSLRDAIHQCRRKGE